MEDGHAGLTYGFEVVDVAGRSLGAYVIKLAPLGVARRGNTDVYRQAQSRCSTPPFAIVCRIVDIERQIGVLMNDHRRCCAA